MEELSPAYSPDQVLEKLRSLKKAKSVVLAGHEPNCSELAAHLLNGAQLEFKKGALCLIESDPVSAGHGILIWHLSPQVLRLMAK
jgi:phosphohistidine phosphatase